MGHKGSLAVTAQWSGPPPQAAVTRSGKTPRQYTLVVSEIDDLVADVLKTSSWNAGVLMGHNPAALEAITLNNAHAAYLTTRQT